MIASEISWSQVYLPPLLLDATIGLVLAWITVEILNRLRWSRFFAAPSLVFLAITTIYTVIFGTFVIPT